MECKTTKCALVLCFLAGFFVAQVSSASGNCTSSGTECLCRDISGKKQLQCRRSENVESLDIRDSDLNAFTATDFSVFRKLEKLRITNCSVPIPPNAKDSIISRLTRLQELNITRSLLSDNYANLFRYNLNLRVISLTNSNITIFTTEFFEHHRNIQTIDLSNNSISEINYYFSEYPSLESPRQFSLLQSFNRRTRFPPLSPTLKHLNLSFNIIGLKTRTHRFYSNATKRCDLCDREILPGNNISAKCREALSDGCKANFVDTLWETMQKNNVLDLKGNLLCLFLGSLSLDILSSLSPMSSPEYHFDANTGSSCKVYESGYCSRHEERRLFLARACRLPPPPPPSRFLHGIRTPILVHTRPSLSLPARPSLSLPARPSLPVRTAVSIPFPRKIPRKAGKLVMLLGAGVLAVIGGCVVGVVKIYTSVCRSSNKDNQRRQEGDGGDSQVDARPPEAIPLNREEI